MESRFNSNTGEASYMANKEEEEYVSESVPTKITFPHDSNSYRIIDEIGNGTRAIVYKAECIPMNSTLVAIKSIDLDHSRVDFENVRRESKMMTLLSHPNVLRAHCSFIVDRRLWVVMPFMSSGSLQSIVASSFPDGLTEPCIAIVLRETLKALCYLHDQGHLHRDIKAGNILIDSNGSIKVADFGVSASIYESNLSQGSISISSSSACVKFTDVAGTPYWMAPEVIHSHTGYSLKADIWSFGITALELAHGRPPLSHLPPSKSLMMKLTKRFRFSDYDKLKHEKNKKFSKSFKEMVKSCLEQDPSKRPTPEKLLKHDFFKNCKSCEYLVKNVLKGLPTVEQRFMDTKLRRLASMNKSSEEEEEYEDHGDGRNGLLSLTKDRRISGWNLNEDGLELVPVFPTEVFDSTVVEQVQYVDDKAIYIHENENFRVPKSHHATDEMIHVLSQVIDTIKVKDNETTNHAQAHTEDDKYICTDSGNDSISKALALEETQNQIIAQNHDQAQVGDAKGVNVAKNETILNGLMSLKSSLDKQRKNVKLMIGMLGGDQSTLERNREEQMRMTIERLMNELDKEKHKNFELELELEYLKLHFSGGSHIDRPNPNCM